jgi:hypothetical protein
VYWYNKSITLEAVGKSKDTKKYYEKAKELGYKGQRYICNIVFFFPLKPSLLLE